MQQGGSGVSQHPRRQGHGLTGVCGGPRGLQSSSGQQHNVPIQAWKETTEISQDPCEEVGGVLGHLGACQPFSGTTKTDATITALTQ